MKKQNENDLQELANKIYSKLGDLVAKAVEENGYLKDENTIYATAFAMISLSADLLSQTSNMNESEIFAVLAEALAESLNIEFKIEDEDSLDQQEVFNFIKGKKSLN